MEKILSIVAMVIAVIALSIIGFGLYNQPEVPTADEIAAKIIVPTNTLVIQELDNATIAKIEELYNEEFEDEVEEKAMNETAKELVLNELSTKDFKKALMVVLNNNSQSIEEYKHIVEIYSVQFEEIELGSEDAIVTIEFKTKFYNNGDAEDESEKAKLTATFLVSELVFDDAFEDAEVELESIELVIVYD